MKKKDSQWISRCQVDFLEKQTISVHFNILLNVITIITKNIPFFFILTQVYLSRAITDILGQINLGCGGLPCAL